MKTGVVALAFDYGEQKKARALPDRTYATERWRDQSLCQAFETATAMPPGQAEIRAALPSGTLMMAHTQLGNQLLGWRLDTYQLKVQTLSSQADEVGKLVVDFLTSLAPGEAASGGEPIYEILIRLQKICINLSSAFITWAHSA